MRSSTIPGRNTPNSSCAPPNNFSMKAFFLRHKKLHIWLLLDLAALALFYLVRGQTAWMNAVARHVTAPLRRGLASITYLTDVSMMEVLCILLVIAVPAYILWSIIAVKRRKGGRLHRAYSAVLGAVCTGLGIWAAFCLLWGINCWTDSFQTRSGIHAQPVSKEDLTAVTAYFAKKLTDCAHDVPRDDSGAFAVPYEDILTAAPYAYDAVEQEFPFLSYDDPGVKAVHFSRVMSGLDFTGIFCPFTAESNVNVDCPASRLGATVAHELAHQRGIFSEQECNFLGILASTTCGDAAYEYAGWSSAFVYAGNALYSVDPETYWAIRAALPREVERDFAVSTAYWDQFADKAPQKVSNTIYDGVLKAWGEELGIRSYGTVVDLLVTYYKDFL